MKIKDACAKLEITRYGLYWLLNQHADKVGDHATKKPNGRWQIDEEAVEILRGIREKSRKVIVEKEPADPHVAETIRGMQITIDNLRAEIAKLELIRDQGLYLRNSIEDILNDFNLDPELERALARPVTHFNTQTSKKVLKKSLKKTSKMNLTGLDTIN